MSTRWKWSSRLGNMLPYITRLNLFPHTEILRLIERWLPPLSTIAQLFYGVSLVSYQYYCSIYPDIKHISRNANIASFSAKEGSHYYHFESIWDDPAVDRTGDLLHRGGVTL